MKYTDNLKLHLPEGSDPVRREPLNTNFQLLDAAWQAMSKDLYTTLWEGGHRWRSYKWVPGTGQPIRASASVVGLAATGSPTFNVLYSDEIAIADDGTVSLVDPASGSYTATGYASEGVMPSLTSFPYPNKYVKIQPLQITAVITKGEWSEVAWAAEGAELTSQLPLALMAAAHPGRMHTRLFPVSIKWSPMSSLLPWYPPTAPTPTPTTAGWTISTM